MPHNSPPHLELSLPKIVAGGLAAASAAVASSWLGIAGTVFGAVVVSVVATVGTALYSHSLERSQHVIKETIPVLATRRRPDRGLGGPETLELSVATASPERRPISWATAAVSCVATLALGFGVLTGFEAVVGRSAADLTGAGSRGATTLGSLVDGGSGSAYRTTLSHPSTPARTGPTSTPPTTTSPTTPTPTSPTTTGPTTTAPTTTSPTTTDPTPTSPTSPATTGPTG
jgi:hypothetical protein